MRFLAASTVCVVMVCGVAPRLSADDVARYEDKLKAPVLEEIEARDTELAEAARAKTDEIIASYTAAQEKPERQLRFDMSDIPRPASPDAFSTRLWHFPPTPQYMTGTCWSFSTTSLMESEIHRLHGRDVKLSEMWTAYWEFVAKARGFVASRGESFFSSGSEANALLRVYREHGVVPRSAYEGVVGEDPRFDHDPMQARMDAFLAWCKEQNFWDEETIVAMVRRILDATMGRPPETVAWEGRELTPQQFLSEVCGLDPDDYVSLMSTLATPFWTRGELDVPDNWWHSAQYVNVPLDVWYQAILDAVDAGYTVAIGGDTSEPGLYGPEDLAVVPSFDVPQDAIDQSSRELRIANGTTTDDHGIHLVGRTVLDGHDFFLIKDSNRSSRMGRFEGYFFYRDDYVRLKMLSYTVHRDAIAQILARVDAAGGE